MRESTNHTRRKLPHGWRLVKLGDVADYVNGRAFKPEEWGTDGLPIIRIQNLTSEQTPFNYFVGQVKECHLVEDGDLLISWSATLDAFIWSRGRAVLNQHIFNAKERPQVVRRDYLYFAVREAMDEIRAQVHGATMRHITKPEFEAIAVPLPPMAEQKRISAILKEQMAAVERARAAAQAQLDAAETLHSAYLRQIFPKPEKELPPGWRHARLAEILLETRNGLYKPDHYYGSGVRILKMFNIGRLDGTWHLRRVDRIELTDEEVALYRLEKDDILLNRVNSKELVGKCAVVDSHTTGAVFESKNMRLRLDSGKARADYVASFLNSMGGRRQVYDRSKQIVGQATVNRSDLGSIQVPLPPLSEQRRLAVEIHDRAVAVRKLWAELQAQLDDINALPSSMLRRAFLGHL